MKTNWETKKDGNIEITIFAAITPNGVVISPEFQEEYNEIKKDALAKQQQTTEEKENAFTKGQLAFSYWIQGKKNEFPECPENLIEEDWKAGFSESYNDFANAGNEKIEVCYDCGSRNIYEDDEYYYCDNCGRGGEDDYPLEGVLEYLYSH